jgi:predicted porin
VELSVEGYYKRSLNLLEYKEGATFMGYTDDWQKQVEVGNGWSYGVEVLLQRTVGPVTGWIGYTWSRSMRQFEHINNGKPFHAKYDREHDLSITLQYQITPRIDIAGTWVYGTGTRGTLTTQVYYVGNNAIEYFKERNGYMMPDYHRLDLAANFHFPHKQFDHILNISCYNVYCRMNPMFVEPDFYSGKLYQVSIFPILPSISYHFKF